MYYQEIFLLSSHSVTSLTSVLMLLLSVLILLLIYVLIPILSMKKHAFPLNGPVRVINSFQTTLFTFLEQRPSS